MTSRPGEHAARVLLQLAGLTAKHDRFRHAGVGQLALQLNFAFRDTTEQETSK